VARDDVEGPRYRPERTSGAISAKGSADFVEICAMLKRKTQDDCGIPSVRIALIARLMIVQKDFGNAAIGETAYGRGEAKAVQREGEVFAGPSVRQADTF
jgi:hypothetical protein